MRAQRPGGGFDRLANERGVIGPQQVPAGKGYVRLPDHPEFADAVANTPGARVTDKGLEMPVERWQSPEQSGMESVRTGVFYLPAKSKAATHFRNPRSGYGGSEAISGTTVVQRPLFVKGAVGGKAPEAAFETIKGKGSVKALDDDIAPLLYKPLRSGQRVTSDDVATILEKWGGDPDLAGDIVAYSTKGNTLRYAIRENVYASAVRNAGHDAVVGYSQRRTGEKYISELFDVRESHYPVPGEPGEVRPPAWWKSKPDAGATPLKMLGLTGAASGGALTAALLQQNQRKP